MKNQSITLSFKKYLKLIDIKAVKRDIRDFNRLIAAHEEQMIVAKRKGNEALAEKIKVTVMAYTHCLEKLESYVA